MKYVIEYWPDRCLTSISMNTIHFNISGWMEFESREEAEAFLERWKDHFFEPKRWLKVVESSK